MSAALIELIDLIRDFTAPNVFNPWNMIDRFDQDKFGDIWRCERLEQHLSCQPEFLLIGEAPGHNGCHFSGVPFTSEQLILDGAIPRVTCNGRISTEPVPLREPSATIVWRELYQLGIAERTVCWNSFGWHPHDPGNPYSNRTPTAAELKAGAPVLHAVLKHFAGCRYIAVGRLAQRALRQADVRVFATVRHPSMGGTTQFREQMRALVGRRAA